ncbi:hypothetical protein ACROYT_G003211 [Oculina patagonica]
MFPQNQGNFGQMPVPGQQMGGFQPRQPYGVQGFAPQQGQQFPGHQMGAPMGPQMGQPMGPQMNPQMRPQMGHQMGPQMGYQMGPQMGRQMGPPMGTQMGLQIGTFPSNVQLGHQFPKQQQLRIEQQRKQAEENMKKQEELMKKKQLEAKQRRLQQSFSAKKPTKTDALDSLFGKNKKGGGSSMSDLIGPLGKETTPKSTSAKTESVFSRPGGSISHHSNLTPGQWGSGFMTSGQMTPQGTPASGLQSEQAGGMDDFGDFSQGPSFPGQGGNDGDFSDFQEAAQPTTQFGGGSFPVMGSGNVPTPPHISGGTNVFSQAPSWHGATSEHSRNIPAPAAGMSTATQHGSYPPTQNMSTAPPFHGVQTGSANQMTSISGPTVASSWSGPSNITQGSQVSHVTGDSPRHRTGSIPVVPTQGGQMTQFTGDTSRTRTGSIPEMMSNVARSGGAMPQPGMPQNQVNMGNQGGATMPTTGSMHMPPSMGPHGGGFGPSHPGAVPVPLNEGPTLQQGLADSTQEPVPEVEDTPERKLELLYGVTLPDWCLHGTDLPGIYKEIAEKTSDACDAIDTNRLFPILMASDLPRDQLGHIWNRANRAVPGQLNLLELRIVLGLVALGQAGLKTERLTLEKLATCKAAPIPTIPEDVLQTKGRGWSFSEPSHEESQSSGMGEGISLSGRHSSTSSDHSIDPNDKYSVFRAVDQPAEATSIAASPSMDSKEGFGVFQSGDQPVMKCGPPPGEVSLFQGGVSQQSGGWNRTEVSSTGGHFQSVMPNKQDEFGDFQGQAGFNNKSISSVPYNLGHNLNQDNDFGDFQSKATFYSGSTIPDINQKASQSKEPDFGNFQAVGSATGSGFNPSMITVKPQEDDFGDFQAGKESGTGSLNAASIQETKQQEYPQKTVDGFGNFQVGGELFGKPKTSELAGINLFSKTANNTSTTKSITNIDSSSLTETDDFGDFQHSPGPLSTSSNSSMSFTSGSSEKLASSLEKFKLSSHANSSTQGSAKTSSLPGKEGLGKNLTNEKDSEDKKKQESKAASSNFASFPVLGNDPSQTASTAKKSDDKYGVFRDVDFGSGGVFNLQKPVAKTAQDQAADDGFADFGGFEIADQSKSGEDSDFGAFKSTENVQSVPFGLFGDPQPTQQQQQQQQATSSSKSSLQDYNQDFGDFNSFGSTHPSNPQPQKDGCGEFGAFGSFVTGPASSSSGSSSRSHSHSTSASDSLINSVSLEPSERYKVLSHDSGRT